MDCGILGYPEDGGVMFNRSAGNSVQDRTFVVT
jgi:hypothetical protein